MFLAKYIKPVFKSNSYINIWGVFRKVMRLIFYLPKFLFLFFFQTSMVSPQNSSYVNNFKEITWTDTDTIVMNI